MYGICCSPIHIQIRVGRLDEKITHMANGKTNTLCLSLFPC